MGIGNGDRPNKQKPDDLPWFNWAKASDFIQKAPTFVRIGAFFVSLVGIWHLFVNLGFIDQETAGKWSTTVSVIGLAVFALAVLIWFGRSVFDYLRRA